MPTCSVKSSCSGYNGANINSCVGTDARILIKPNEQPTVKQTALPKNSVGFILTSPPYAGAQKYVRASSLSLGWLGMTEPKTLKQLENKSIGREHFVKSALIEIPTTGIEAADKVIGEFAQLNRVRAAICAYYLCEMDEAIGEIGRVLKPNGKAVVVIGDNTFVECRSPRPSSSRSCSNVGECDWR